jgi:hypothetical protein
MNDDDVRDQPSVQLFFLTNFRIAVYFFPLYQQLERCQRVRCLLVYFGWVVCLLLPQCFFFPIFKVLLAVSQTPLKCFPSIANLKIETLGACAVSTNVRFS